MNTTFLTARMCTTFSKNVHVHHLTHACASAGEAESASVTSWPALPPELEEEILAKLSVLELARVSLTCKKFHAVFSQKMPEEQKTRCDVAVAHFGRGRIACIATLVDRCLKGETVHPRLSKDDRNRCWILADGTVYVEDWWREGEGEDRGPRPCEGEDLEVDILFGLARCENLILETLILEIWIEGEQVVEILLCPQVSVTIELTPESDDDVLALALVQVLLTQDLVPVFQTHDIPVNVTVGRYGTQPTCTLPGLQGQIAPLLALASQYGFEVVARGSEPVRRHSTCLRPWPVLQSRSAISV
jgi:hypothetical protein